MEDLLEKIRKIEALIEGAKTDGEKSAAILAKNRIRKKLIAEEKTKKIEYTLRTSDSWHKKLLVAICRKYGVRPYRYKRQKYTTVMVHINEQFLEDVLWPEYLEYSKHLEELVEEVTNNIIRKIHEGGGEDIIQDKLE